MSTQATYDSTVNSFYLAFYGRPADPAGLNYWSAQLAAANGDAAAIIDAFAASDEATARFGADTATQRVTDMYEQLFNRAPDAAGLAYWSNAVASGNVSLASVAVTMLSGAQGTDTTLVALREQAMESFTAQVAASGTAYSGYAAITAASVLVRAVTLESSADDVAALVKAVVSFADTATKTPAVVDAIATGSTLAALYDTARGSADPVALTQALADVAKAAAGDPATLDSLLRGGGMVQVLKVMPAGATLQDVVNALATGGLAAAIDVVYPTASAPTPTPFALSFKSVTEGVLDTHHDNVTNVANADVVFKYTGTLASRQHIEYSLDGETWTTAGDVSTANKTVTLHDIDLTEGAGAVPAFAGVHTFGYLSPYLTTSIQVRAADASGAHTTALTQSIVFDNHVATPYTYLDNDTGRAGLADGSYDGITSDGTYVTAGIEGGATLTYLVDTVSGTTVTPGTDWTTKAPTLHEGLNSFTVQQTDLAGNSSKEQVQFTLDTTPPTVTETFAYVEDSGADAAVSDLPTAAVYFTFSGAPAAGDGFEYRIGAGEWTDISTSNWDTKTDTLRIDGVDLSTSAQTVSVRAVDAAGNTGTVASQVVDSSYHYEVSTLVGVSSTGALSDPTDLTLTTKGDTIVSANFDALGLYAHAEQNASVPTNYAEGGKMDGNHLMLAASQPLDAYMLAFGDDAFATNGASGHGYVAGGMVSMLGGVDHNLTVGVVSLPDSSVQEIAGDITVDHNVTASSAYFTDEISARIQTGGGMDAIIDNGNADITLVYDTLASTGPDVMIGFDSGSDAIELNGNAAIAVDTNRNGVLAWATAPQADVKFVVGAGTEAVEISTTGAIVIGNTTADAAQTAQTLNAALDVSGLSAGAGVLVLANDADHSVLFYVNDTKHDGIDAADVTVIAVMGQGEVHQGDIHIVGSNLQLP